eukprot:Hpha_TRINITY_DN14515_c0_g1::TRINITY_DN14515_c0_g1_i1::g.46407::m.46407
MPVVYDAAHGAARYTGDVTSSGHRQGFGIMCYHNGERYSGDWVAGQRCGEGMYAYADGTVYDGGWEADSAQGRGVCFYATGNVYEGEWRAGHLSGRGAMFYDDGDVYDGEWLDGRLHGEGTYTYADGTTHKGRWEENARTQISDPSGAPVVTAEMSEVSPKSDRRLAMLNVRRGDLDDKRSSLRTRLEMISQGCASGSASGELLEQLRPLPQRLLSRPAEGAVANGHSSVSPEPAVRVDSLREPEEDPPWAPSVAGPAVLASPQPVGPAFARLSGRSWLTPGRAASGTMEDASGASTSDGARERIGGGDFYDSSSDSSSDSGCTQDPMEMPRRIFDRLKRSRHDIITRSQLAADLNLALADEEVQLTNLQHRHAWNRVVQQGAETKPDEPVKWEELERDMISELSSRRERFVVTKLSDGSVGIFTQGNRITEVLPGSPADRSGVKLGMILVRVADRPVMGAEDIESAINSAGPVFTITTRTEGSRKRRASVDRVGGGGDMHGTVPMRTLNAPAPPAWVGSQSVGDIPLLEVTPPAPGGSPTSVPSHSGLPMNQSFTGLLIPSAAQRAFAALSRPRGQLGGAANHCAMVALYGEFEVEDRLREQRRVALQVAKDREKREGEGSKARRQSCAVVDSVDDHRNSRFNPNMSGILTHQATEPMEHDTASEHDRAPEERSDDSSLESPRSGPPACRWQSRQSGDRLAPRASGSFSGVPSASGLPSPLYTRRSARQMGVGAVGRTISGGRHAVSQLHWKSALAKCGPADENFSAERFCKHMGMMVFPFPFLPCFPLAPSLADWERRVVVAGGRPRLWEDPTPSRFLVGACAVVPLLVISIVYGAQRREVWGDEVMGDDGATAVNASDIWIPLVFYAFFSVLSAALHAFPREPHALEKLDDKCFDVLAQIAYEKIPACVKQDIDDFVVKWNSDVRSGPRRFRANTRMKRNWKALSFVLGLWVGAAIPVHRWVEYDTLWGTHESERVVSILSAIANWVIAAGVFELVLRLHCQQLQLVLQLRMLTEAAVLGASEGEAKTEGKFDLLEVPADSLDKWMSSGGALHNFVGWFFVRSFTFYGSPALNHNARCAVTGCLVMGVVLLSIALCSSFVADLILFSRPGQGMRAYTMATSVLLPLVPLLTRQLHMWLQVRHHCKKHYRLVASAAVFKHAEALRLHTEKREEDAAECQLQGLLLGSVSTMLADQDYRPRLLGIDLGPRVALFTFCASLMGLTTLGFRWYYHLADHV